MNQPLVRIILTVFFCCYLIPLKAQVPVVKAVKYYSGIDDRQLIFYDVKPIRNKGFIVVGADSTFFPQHPAPFKYGGEKPVILKLDSVGNLVWKKSIPIGDSATFNSFSSVLETDDGGFVAVGKTGTNSDISQLLIMRFNSAGETIWQKLYGGTSDDRGYEINEVSTGGFIVVGTTNSTNGNVSGNKGGEDVWLLRINEDGSVKWSKCFGGSDSDFGYSVVQASDFGFIVAGSSLSSNGDITGANAGSLDGWLFKTDSSGNLLWQKLIGNNFYNMLHNVRIMPDNSIVLAGQFFKTEQDPIIGPIPKPDFWVVKTSSTGTVLWSKTFGGSKDDEGYTIQPLFDNSILVSGTTTSTDGDINEPDVLFSPWLIKLSAQGDVVWKTVLDRNKLIWSYQSLFIRENEYISLGSDLGSSGLYRGILYRLGSANSIKGQLYLDANANNTKDAVETGFNNGLVIVKKQGVEITSASPYNGTFEMPVDTGSYVTSVQLFNPYYTVVPSSRNSTFNSHLNTDSFSFAIQPIANKQDLIAHLLPVSPARPGFKAQYVLNYKNIGTTTIANGTVKLIKDSRSTYSISLPLPASIVADTITWNYTNLKPLDSIAIGIELQLSAPPTLNNNDTLKYTAVVLPVTGDLTPADDSSSLKQLVQGSYDPNDKQEGFAGRMPLKKIQDGAYINYIIRFQNTGNDTAFTVRLMDTLENKLDWSSFEMIGSSHKYSLTIKEGNKLQWVFNDIKLPDSTTNLTRSIGFVAFRIKPKNTVVTNDVIQNKASIYFDYNLPVVTNSANITITNEVITAVRELQNDEMKLQFGPNPSSGYSNLMITGKLKGKFELRIIDNSGSIISQQTITRNSIAETNNIPVHLEKLSSGVYYIQLQQKGKSWWQKIILQ